MAPRGTFLFGDVPFVASRTAARQPSKADWYLPTVIGVFDAFDHPAWLIKCAVALFSR